MNKAEKRSLDFLTLVEAGDGAYEIQVKDKSLKPLNGKWKLGKENSTGWMSVRNIKSGKYLTLSSKDILSEQGMIPLKQGLIQHELDGFHRTHQSEKKEGMG